MYLLIKYLGSYFLESRWVKLNSYCLTHNLSVGLCFFSKHNLWKLKDARLTILYLFFTKAKCLKPISTGGVSSNDTVFFRLDDFRLLLRRRWLFLWSGFFYETDWAPPHVLWHVSFGCWVTWSISSWQEYYKSVFFPKWMIKTIWQFGKIDVLVDFIIQKLKFC